MNMLWVIGGIFAAILLILAFCAGVIFLEKRFPSDAYDERQKIAQGKANRLAMIVGLFYFMIVMVILIRQVDGPKTVEPYLLIFIGILLMVTVDHAYCFLSHAYLPLSENPMTSVICYALGGLAQLLYIWEALDRFPLSLVGHGTASWIHLLMGMDFLFLAAMHLIQLLRDRKEME